MAGYKNTKPGQLWEANRATGKPNRFRLGRQDSGHRVFTKAGVMLSQVGIDAGLICVAEIASDRARPLGPFEDTHRGRMAHGVAVDHFFVEPGQLGIFLDDDMEVVSGESAEQHRIPPSFRQVDYGRKVADGVSGFDDLIGSRCAALGTRQTNAVFTSNRIGVDIVSAQAKSLANTGPCGVHHE